MTETAEPTGITLPSSGCWELEANLGGDRLIIVVQATQPRADSSR